MGLLLDAPEGGRQVSVDNDSSFKDDAYNVSTDIHNASVVMESGLTPCAYALGLDLLPQLPGLDQALALANDRRVRLIGSSWTTQLNETGAAIPPPVPWLPNESNLGIH
jgi:hypothetical protein